MLKTKFEKNDYVIIKLVSGEEILGKIVTSDKDELKIKGAFSLMQPMPGQFMISPYLLGTDPETIIPFNKSQIVSLTPANSEISTQAISAIREQTGGIITTDTPSIIV